MTAVVAYIISAAYIISRCDGGGGGGAWCGGGGVLWCGPASLMGLRNWWAVHREDESEGEGEGEGESEDESVHIRSAPAVLAWSHPVFTAAALTAPSPICCDICRHRT